MVICASGQSCSYSVATSFMIGAKAVEPAKLICPGAQVGAGVARPGALDRTVHLSFGDTSGREYVTQLIADLTIHGWDLARATGQDATLDPDAVALLLPWSEANAELLGGSGMFGVRVAAALDAPDDVRLLGLLGRA